MSIASLGIDFGVLNALNLWVACLLPAKEGQIQLVNAVFHEDRPDLGEIKLISRDVTTRLPMGVTDLVLPTCNYSRMMSLWLWQGWLEGSNLCALPSAQAPVIRVSLGAPPARLIRPALSVASGEFDLPLIEAGGRGLAMVRFVPEREGRAAGGSVLWRMPLASEPITARAALGPAKKGSSRHIVLALQEKEGVSLELLDVTAGRQPSAPAKIHLPKFFAIPKAEPGIRIDDTGTTHVSILLASGADFMDVSIADVSFPPGGAKPPEPKIEKARKLTVPITAAGVAYQSRPDRPMRRDWVMLLGDGSLIHSLSRDKSMRPNGKPITPLEMVALSQSTYILTLRVDGPFLEALR